MTLGEKIDRYNELQVIALQTKTEMDELKASITKEMGDEGITKFTTENDVEAKIAEKTYFKYNDELAIIKYLKEHELAGFIKESINTSCMNNELKKKGTLTEDLKGYYTTTTSPSLSVKVVKEDK